MPEKKYIRFINSDYQTLFHFAVVLYISGKHNRRPGEEHGSARWGNPRQLDRKCRDKDPKRNAILTQNLRMSLNSRQHFRNLLQIVVGGSGAGKTRYIVKPNIYEANASYIATDPKGGTRPRLHPPVAPGGVHH